MPLLRPWITTYRWHVSSKPRTVQKYFNPAKIEKEWSADFDCYLIYALLRKTKRSSSLPLILPQTFFINRDLLPYSVPGNSCWLSCLQCCCVLNSACDTVNLKMIAQYASKRWINLNISRISPEVFLCTE